MPHATTQSRIESRTLAESSQYISKESHLRKIFLEYQHLKYFGFNARYEVIGFTAQDVTEAAQDYEKIRVHIAPRL
jgi:hypothetical protein